MTNHDEVPVPNHHVPEIHIPGHDIHVPEHIPTMDIHIPTIG